MNCPRCGTKMQGGVCPECGFPVNQMKQNGNKTRIDRYVTKIKCVQKSVNPTVL